MCAGYVWVIRAATPHAKHFRYVGPGVSQGGGGGASSAQQGDGPTSSFGPSYGVADGMLSANARASTHARTRVPQGARAYSHGHDDTRCQHKRTDARTPRAHTPAFTDMMRCKHTYLLAEMHRRATGGSELFGLFSRDRRLEVGPCLYQGWLSRSEFHDGQRPPKAIGSCSWCW